MQDLYALKESGTAFVARIDPTCGVQRFTVPGRQPFEAPKHPNRQDSGWYPVTAKDAEVLRRRRKTDNPNSPFVFQVRTPDEAIAAVKSEQDRVARGQIPDAQFSQHEVRQLRADQAETKAELVQTREALALAMSQLQQLSGLIQGLKGGDAHHIPVNGQPAQAPVTQFTPPGGDAATASAMVSDDPTTLHASVPVNAPAVQTAPARVGQRKDPARAAPQAAAKAAPASQVAAEVTVTPAEGSEPVKS